MTNIINAGVVGCDMSEEFFQSTASNKMESFKWTKIFSTNKIAENITRDYPGATVVDNIEAIVNDKDITLVIVSSKELASVKQIIEGGKSVRLI
jgi:predicted dehydrogenase